MIRMSVALFRYRFLGRFVLQAPGCSSHEDRAQGHYERGMKLLAQNEPCEGQPRIQECAAAQEGSGGAWRGSPRSKSTIRTGSRSLQSCAQSPTRPDDVDARLRLARLIFMVNQLDRLCGR